MEDGLRREERDSVANELRVLTTHRLFAAHMRRLRTIVLTIHTDKKEFISILAIDDCRAGGTSCKSVYWQK